VKQFLRQFRAKAGSVFDRIRSAVVASISVAEGASPVSAR
jgi:hypothetical protein